MPKLGLDRAQIAKIAGGVPQAIAALEKVFGDVASMPSTIEDADSLAGQGLAAASQAFAMLAEVLAAVEQLVTAPACDCLRPDDGAAPRQHVGTLGEQNHDAVDITGGVAGFSAGAAALPPLYFGGDRASGLYRSAPNVIAVTISGTQRAYFDVNTLGVWGSVTASQQLIANAPAGTPPLSVVSAARVANLNVERAGLADTATVAGKLTNPSTFPAAATDLSTVIALANSLRSAAISKGL